MERFDSSERMAYQRSGLLVYELEEHIVEIKVGYNKPIANLDFSDF